MAAVLVTGGARRIGQAICLGLAKRGFDVAIHYHASATEAAALVEEIRAGGGRAAALNADLSDVSALDLLVAHATAAVGPLTCLVNNAAIFEHDTIFDATMDSFDRHLNINLRAPFFLSQSFARHLPPDAEGAIVNLIDMRVWKMTAHFASYTVAKAGLWALTQTLAMALAPRIRVNAIGPGPSLIGERQTPEQFAHQQAATPLGRGATPEEIAEAIHFLLKSPSITGQMLALDGGQHLPSPTLAQQPRPRHE